jgi:hypothetical protein
MTPVLGIIDVGHDIRAPLAQKGNDHSGPAVICLRPPRTGPKKSLSIRHEPD